VRVVPKVLVRLVRVALAVGEEGARVAEGVAHLPGRSNSRSR